MERIAELTAINSGSPIAGHKKVNGIAFVHFSAFPGGDRLPPGGIMPP
jgi:hypothetical protein